MRLRLVVYVLSVAAAGALLAAPGASARGLHPAIEPVALFKGRIHGTRAYPAIRGAASIFESSDERGITVNLWRAGRFSGRRLTLYVSGQLVGTMLVGSRGGAHLHHDTNKNQAVPKIRLGHYGIRVRTRRGVLVARGRLRFVSPH